MENDFSMVTDYLFGTGETWNFSDDSMDQMPNVITKRNKSEYATNMVNAREESRKYQKEHSKLLAGFNRGKLLLDLGTMAFTPWERRTFAHNCMICLHVFMAIMLFLITRDLLITAAVYGAVNFTARLSGKKIVKQNGEKLKKMEETLGSLLYEFKENACGFYNTKSYSLDLQVPGGQLTYSGSIKTPMKKFDGQLVIYRLEDSKEYGDYLNMLNGEFGKNIMDFSKKIASVEFKKHYGVLTTKNNELACMQFFTAPVVLAMVQATSCKHVQRMEIKDGCFHATTGKAMKMPKKLDLFTKTPLERYFQDFERYCKEFRQMGDEVDRELKQLAAMF